jgi:nitroreductase/NAD-dependent dihydropyrimidine dehydrogenase PreA subunit
MTVIHGMFNESGRIEIDESSCEQCGLCAGICPAENLIFEDGRVEVFRNSPFGCIACGHCMMVCPQGSIRVTGRGLCPEDLMPLPPPEERATADQLEALFRSRRSIRQFREREVEAGLLERIVGMASSGPMGIPPWDVGITVVCGREKVQEVAAEIVRGYEKFIGTFKPWMLPLLRPFMGRASYEQFRTFILPLGKLYVESRREGKDMLFYDAPAVLIFHHSPYADLADATIACTYAMLAAESLGLGNTMIGGAPPILERNRNLSRRLGIPEGNRPALSLIVGYPAAKFRHSIRRSFAAVNTVQ